MGVGMTNQPPGKPVWMAVPSPVVAFLNRVMALPRGIHTITLVKDENGSVGIACWSVVEGKVETARKPR